MNLNDNRLIIKTLKSGDQKVFSLVYASYYKPLCLFCSSYVSLEEAEEIVQDLMMYVWEKRELLVEDLSLKSFLFTSVRNRALNSITRSHITRQVYEEYQSQQLKSLPALDSCYGTELFNAYMEALHSLPKELQRVYVMEVCRNARCTSFFVHHYTNLFTFFKLRSFEDFFDLCVPSI